MTIKTIQQLCLTKGLTIAAAESCTGGMLSQILTSQPGSSGYFLGSIIAYSNRVKTDVLGVERASLQKYGAVSGQVAEQMAAQVRQILNSSIGISLTGIAGPSGGSEDKPVGLVYISIALEGQGSSFEHVFAGDREQIRQQACQAALNLLQNFLINQYRS